jgi:hypothetical protein
MSGFHAARRATLTKAGEAKDQSYSPAWQGESRYAAFRYPVTKRSRAPV